MSRQFVHLSADPATARDIGARHGNPVVLGVRAAELHAGGMSFYAAAEGVWLIANVPAEALFIVEDRQHGTV